MAIGAESEKKCKKKETYITLSVGSICLAKNVTREDRTTELARKKKSRIMKKN
jgi:hypothetical protein